MYIMQFKKNVIKIKQKKTTEITNIELFSYKLINQLCWDYVYKVCYPN